MGLPVFPDAVRQQTFPVPVHLRQRLRGGLPGFPGGGQCGPVRLAQVRILKVQLPGEQQLPALPEGGGVPFRQPPFAFRVPVPEHGVPPHGVEAALLQLPEESGGGLQARGAGGKTAEIHAPGPFVQEVEAPFVQRPQDPTEGLHGLLEIGGVQPETVCVLPLAGGQSGSGPVGVEGVGHGIPVDPARGPKHR